MKSEGTRQDQEGFDNFFRKSIDVITVYEFNAALHTLVELGDAPVRRPQRRTVSN